MTSQNTLIKKWTGPYSKMGKHRKRCQICNRLVQDGEIVVFGVFQQSAYYPVKGLMKFNTLYVQHIGHAQGWAAEMEGQS